MELLPETAMPMAARTDKGIHLRTSEAGTVDFPSGRRMIYSHDGSKFAFCNTEKVFIIDTKTGKTLVEMDCKKTIYIIFSPSDKYITTWTRYITDKNNKGDDNVHVFDTETGELKYTTVIIRQEKWEPMFSPDDQYFGQMYKNEIHFYSTANFQEGIKMKIRAPGVDDYAMSPGPDPCVAIFIPSAKSKPASVQIHRLSNLEIITSKKSFFGASKVDFFWSFDGTRLLVKTFSEEVGDKSNYMGSDGALYYMSVDGSVDCAVDLSKEGNQLHSVAWCPNKDLFVVVFGHSPAKAMLFGANCKPEFTFDSPSYRNVVNFSPHGNLVCIAGFGNLRGTMEYWDVRSKRLVSRYTSPDTTMHFWCPDSEHMLTATHTPRLRTDNHFKIWHYNGNTEINVPFKELYEAIWQPFPAGALPLKPTIPVQKNTTAAARPVAYRAPGTRELPKSLRTDEPTTTGVQGLEARLKAKKDVHPPGYVAPKLTKAQLKNKKKRENKAKAAQAAAENPQGEAKGKAASPATTVASSSNKPAAPEPQVFGGAMTSDELTKRLRNLKKKLGQINDLKTKQENGQPLEENQLTKIKSESVVLNEIAQLEESLKMAS